MTGIDLLRGVAGLASVVLVLSAVSAEAQTVGPSADVVAQGVDRPGGDYRSFDLGRADPNACWRTCREENRCVAWTYVKPNIQGANARCWLKDVVPTPIMASCCQSGVINVFTRLRACEQVANKTGSGPAQCINGNDGKADFVYRKGHIEIFANLRHVPTGTHRVTAVYKKRDGNTYRNFSGNKQEFDLAITSRSFSFWFQPKYFGRGDYIATVFLSKVPGVAASTQYAIN
jgi:hypothetical protein